MEEAIVSSWPECSYYGGLEPDLCPVKPDYNDPQQEAIDRGAEETAVSGAIYPLMSGLKWWEFWVFKVNNFNKDVIWRLTGKMDHILELLKEILCLGQEARKYL